MFRFPSLTRPSSAQILACSAFKFLCSLSLSFCEWTAEHDEALSKLLSYQSTLRSLALHGRDSDFTPSAPLPSTLEYLSLRQFKLRCSPLPNLKRLYVECVTDRTDISDLLPRFPNLQQLFLGGFEALSVQPHLAELLSTAVPHLKVNNLLTRRKLIVT